MTMRELARLAHVSVSTVSKAFHDADDISEDTKKLVFDTAKQYGCYGKFYRGKFHKQIIAIICPELGTSLYTIYVEHLQKIIEEHGGIVLISVDYFNTTAQAELLDYYASYLQVDGIIILHLTSQLKKGYDIPIVALFDSKNAYTDTVQINYDAPFAEAVSLLRSLGHEKIAFVTEALTHHKEKTFLNTMGNSPEAACVIQSQYRFEKAGEDAAQQILEQYPDFTAIICAYDAIAFGMIRHMKRCGYSVPGDYSVIGIDNISTAQHYEPPLTTIDTNPEELCLLAWDIIQKKQESKFYRSTQAITISGRLIVRETVGKKK